MPTGWKRRLASHVIGTAAPFCAALARPGQLRILNYHRINYRTPDFPFDPDVISATPDLFDRQVAFCRAHFDVISFRDLQAIVSNQHRPPRRALIISFDDGYADNHGYAFPILKRHGVSAIFFLATDYIGTARAFWWDEVVFALKACSADRLPLEISGERGELDLSTPAARRASAGVVLKRLKGVPDGERVRVVDRLTAAAGARQRLSDMPRQAMTWDEAREMLAHGMEIGSHSRSHPILSRVTDPQALDAEIGGSKAAIEAHLAAPVTVFSYPVGGSQAINENVKHVVRMAGYNFAVTYINGFNRLTSPPDRHALNRLHVDGLSESEFRMRLIAPHL